MNKLENCEFCGEVMEPLFCEAMGKRYFVGYRECSCEGAAKARLEHEKAIVDRRARENADKFARLIAKSGIPERYREIIVKSKHYKTALERGLYLFGGTGTGKTTIASQIGLQAIREGKTVRFIKAYKLPDVVNEDIGEITKPDLLIIDDLGADFTGEWSNTRLRAAIDDRYDSMKPVVITSNYSKDQLAKLLLRNVKDMTPKSIISRLSEMTESVEVNGKDYRR